MKSLHTLIQLAQQELDGLRNDINVYLDKRAEIEVHNNTLDDSLENERHVVEQDASTAQDYANYALMVRIKKENNNKIISTLNQNINVISEKISEAYAVLKTYELLLEKKQQEQLAEDNLREQKEVDELTQQRFQHDNTAST